MKVFFNDTELKAVRRSLRSSVNLYSRAVRNEQPGGMLARETSNQKFRSHQRHLKALQDALRRLTPSGGAVE